MGNLLACYAIGSLSSAPSPKSAVRTSAAAAPSPTRSRPAPFDVRIFALATFGVGALARDALGWVAYPVSR